MYENVFLGALFLTNECEKLFFKVQILHINKNCMSKNYEIKSHCSQLPFYMQQVLYQTFRYQLTEYKLCVIIFVCL